MLLVACCGHLSLAVQMESSSRIEMEVSPVDLLHVAVDDEVHREHHDDCVNGAELKTGGGVVGCWYRVGAVGILWRTNAFSV